MDPSKRSKAVVIAVGAVVFVGVGGSIALRPITSAHRPGDAAEQPAASTSAAPSSMQVLTDETADVALMVELHRLAETDPERTLTLARAGNVRYALSPSTAERSWMIVQALVALNRFEEARIEAVSLVENHPKTSWASDVKQHMLTHEPYPTEPSQTR